MQNLKANIIVNKTFDFSLKIIEYSEKLETMNKYIISRQILKAGTAIGANVHEAQNAESMPDFIHKMKIAAKEADECLYWLRLCKHSNYPDCENLINDTNEIIKILSRIIATSKNKVISIVKSR